MNRLKKPRISDGQGHFASIKPGIGKKMYEGEKKATNKIINSTETQIEWEFGGQIIKLSESECAISGCPSLDYQFFLSDWWNSNSYPKPNNAVLFNPDGTIHKVLEQPLLLSEYAKELGIERGDYFMFPSWKKHPETGETVLTIDISFYQMYYETRVVNAESGTFGDCIYASRN